MTWITANLGTIIVCAVLAVLVAAAIISMVRNRKKGNSSCGCSCSSCAYAGKCHPVKK